MKITKYILNYYIPPTVPHVLHSAEWGKYLKKKNVLKLMQTFWCVNLCSPFEWLFLTFSCCSGCNEFQLIDQWSLLCCINIDFINVKYNLPITPLPSLAPPATPAEAWEAASATTPALPAPAPAATIAPAPAAPAAPPAPAPAAQPHSARKNLRDKNYL